jgi:hypothetical protein
MTIDREKAFTGIPCFWFQKADKWNKSDCNKAVKKQAYTL